MIVAVKIQGGNLRKVSERCWTHKKCYKRVSNHYSETKPNLKPTQSIVHLYLLNQKTTQNEL